MYIFVDESGIHKTIDHSVFVLVYVEVEDHILMEERVKQVEKKIVVSIS